VSRFYSYDGDWQSGFMEGRGVYLFDDECKYEGEFKAGKAHGEGTTVYPGGQSYFGLWKEGRTLIQYYYYIGSKLL
jgi:hypothetical protein